MIQCKNTGKEVSFGHIIGFTSIDSKVITKFYGITNSTTGNYEVPII